jgi:hypothetical protein
MNSNITRNPNGQFTKRNRYILRITIFIILSLAILALTHYYIITHPTIINTTTTVDTSPAMFAQKIDSLEKSVVEQVRACESNGHKESDGLIIFDSNKIASIGTLQFQTHTIIYYYKSLYHLTITPKEAIIIALDDAKAGELAKDIMFTSPNLANDWLNCSTRLSLTSTIQAIKKISK